MMHIITQLVVAQMIDDDTTDRREILRQANEKAEPVNLGDVFRKHWHSDDLVDTNLLLVAACILFGILLIMYSMRTFKQRKHSAHPLTTFNVIAAELKLSMSEKWLLVRIARQQDLPTPLALLLSPATLRHHALRFASDLGPAGKQKVLFRIREIRQRLMN